MKDLIIGYGEIGKSIGKVLEQAGVDYDAFDNAFPCAVEGDYNVMHVCVPFSKKFVKSILNYVGLHRPNYVVIHSTVDIGTTRKLQEKSESGWFVHSPVVGVHPNLYDGLITFTKFFGAPIQQAAEDMSNYFNLTLGLNTRVMESSETTEMAKLLSTTYYGWNITFNKEVALLCDEYGLDFNQVYNEWNENYNRGYKILNMNNVIRPILKYVPGKIGGHCIMPNVEILKNKFSIAKIIKKLSRKW